MRSIHACLVTVALLSLPARAFADLSTGLMPIGRSTATRTT